MKKIIIVACFLISGAVAFGQRQGIGIRLGDPMGLTYKKFVDKKHAFELGLGTAGPGWHNDYYRNSFDEIATYQNYRYRSHQVTNTLYLQARYLIHNPIYVQDLEGNWDWYWGIGGVLKLSKIRYRFEDGEPPFNNEDIYNDVDLGPEGIIGTEYTFEGIPISVFGDVSLMMEFVNRISLRPFGGAGIRYNF